MYVRSGGSTLLDLEFEEGGLTSLSEGTAGGDGVIRIEGDRARHVIPSLPL